MFVKKLIILGLFSFATANAYVEIGQDLRNTDINTGLYYDDFGGRYSSEYPDNYYYYFYDAPYNNYYNESYRNDFYWRGRPRQWGHYNRCYYPYRHR